MSMNFKIQQIVFENLLSQSSHGNEASNDGVRLALWHWKLRAQFSNDIFKLTTYIFFMSVVFIQGRSKLGLKFL